MKYPSLAIQPNSHSQNSAFHSTCILCRGKIKRYLAHEDTEAAGKQWFFVSSPICKTSSGVYDVWCQLVQLGVVRGAQNYEQKTEAKR